jgi:methionyl aminopeptidase
MIRLKSEKDIEILREGGKHLAFVLSALKKASKPGVTTKELDDLAYKLTTELGDKPAFLNYKPYGASRPFPASACISINNEIVHGIPNESKKVLKDGDIVSLDMGLIHKGLFVDSAITVAVGKIDEDAKKLLKFTKQSLDAGIKAMKIGGHIGDIGQVIAKVAHKNKYGIAEGLCGHGVGFAVHEDPYVPNEGIQGEGPELVPGLVIAIEPMFNEGTGQTKIAKDNWTYLTKDGKRSAHFEHTVAITKDGIEILTK